MGVHYTKENTLNQTDTYCQGTITEHATRQKHHLCHLFFIFCTSLLPSSYRLRRVLCQASRPNKSKRQET